MANLKIGTKFTMLLAIAVAFLLGQLASPRGDEKQLREMFKKEREVYQQRISDLQSQIAAQDAISESIRERMTIDSLKYLDALKRKEIAISKLNRKISEINLSYSNASDLDSIRAYILRAR